MRRGEVILGRPVAAEGEAKRKAKHQSSGRSGWDSPGWRWSTAIRSCRSPPWVPRDRSTSSWTGTTRCRLLPAFVEVLGSRTRCRSTRGGSACQFRDRNVGTTGSATDPDQKVKGRQNCDAVVRALLEQNQKAVEHDGRFLIDAERENDPNRSVIRRLWAQERGSVPDGPTRRGVRTGVSR